MKLKPIGKVTVARTAKQRRGPRRAEESARHPRPLGRGRPRQGEQHHARRAAPPLHRAPGRTRHPAPARRLTFLP